MIAPSPDDDTAVRAAREGLLAVRKAAVDASSLIYMLKAGFLGYAAAEVDFLTVAPVAAEVRWPELPVRIADLRRGGEVPWTTDVLDMAEAYVGAGKHANDELLLELAMSRRLPVVSEDRRVLERAEEEGLSHYNAPMLLALTSLRGRIGPVEYEAYAEILGTVGHYAEAILSFSRAVASPSLST